MINFPIVDAHLHVWDPAKIRYPWLEKAPLLNRAHLLNDYNLACKPYNVEQMVFVQCEAEFSQYRDEADWVSSLAKEDRRIKGIVAWAPLEKGDAAEAELAALASNKLVKGIRRIIQFEPDVNFCLQPGFIKGVQQLARHGLSFDICIKGDAQAVNTLKLIGQCGDVKCILDHIGKPFINEKKLEPWKSHVKEFAAMPHVCCKMSGLVVEADLKNWTAQDLRPYIDHVLECFGPKRIVFGGDWPVVLNATELSNWIKTLDSALSNLSDTERRAIFHDNAIQFYRLS